MKTITKIDAVTRDNAKLRVAAYARVSTDSEEQLLSLKAQKMHYENLIRATSYWDYMGLYYDEGVSGTKAKNRKGLQSMLDDCEKGLIDRVITKSISRLSRNVTDCLGIVRRLTELGISIYFEKENIDTASMESELMLTVLSSMAESESVSISENAKWSIKRRFQNGTYIISSPPYGYRNEGGEMVIVQEEAEIVRRIFRQTLSGDGAYLIAKGLNADGIPSKKNAKWSSYAINAILKNEKYIGDALFQKTYTDENFKRHTNKGERDIVYIEENHEPIISREDFQNVQDIVNQRREEKNILRDNAKYQNRYTFSGKILCGNCGSTFKRKHVYNSNEKYITWACDTHIKNRHACKMKVIKDADMKAAFTVMMGKLKSARTHMIVPFIKSLSDVDDEGTIVSINGMDEELEKISERKKVLNELVNAGVVEPVVFAAESNEIKAEEERIRIERNRFITLYNNNISWLNEAEKLNEFLSKYKFNGEFNDDAFEMIVESVVIKSRKEAVFHLKCGLCLRERLGD